MQSCTGRLVGYRSPPCANSSSSPSTFAKLRPGGVRAVAAESLIASSASAPNPPASMASRYSGCSIAPARAKACPSTPAPTTTRCLDTTAGSPTCASSEVAEIKSVPYALSHPFVERLIGTIRREYLDREFFWNAADLARRLREFRDHYHPEPIIVRTLFAQTHLVAFFILRQP